MQGIIVLVSAGLLAAVGIIAAIGGVAGHLLGFGFWPSVGVCAAVTSTILFSVFAWQSLRADL
jgi:hypothetical protein